MNLNIAIEPLVPLPLIAVLAAAVLLLALTHRLRGVSGAGVRMSAALLLIAALCNPVLMQREVKALNDIVFLAIDNSPSQQLGARPGQTKALAEQVRARLARISGLDVKEVTIAGGDGETRLFKALNREIGKAPPERIAGAIVITDGQVHDIPKQAGEAGLNAPLHALITGSADEKDRRLLVRNAPRFGLIGKPATIDIRIEDMGGDKPLPPALAQVSMWVNGEKTLERSLFTNRDHKLPVRINHRGENVIEISVAPLAGELTRTNNRAALSTAGIRDRLRVLLVSGAPHPGERTWRQLLKSDPMVDLVHFTILRPPDKLDGTSISELSLIAFPTRQLFVEKLSEFDLIIFDRYHRQNVLPLAYLENVADYVRGGGAVLVAAGPAFATPFSLFRTPLSQILPAIPGNRIIEQPYRPLLTDVGSRHPVTRGLPGGAVRKPTWGRWFRLVDSEAKTGNTVMSGPEGKPLLILSDVAKGRVALLLSDHAWLWTRGFEGGGPQAELLRRLAHWLMKEPDLEEEALSAMIRDGRLTITRRSLKRSQQTAKVTAPDGATQQVTLSEHEPGIWRGAAGISAEGLYRIRHDGLTAIAASGAVDTREFQDVRSSGKALAPLAAQTGGVVLRAGAADDISAPGIRMVKPGRAYGGADWLGLKRNGAERLIGEKRLPLLYGFITILLLLGAAVFTWRRESR